MPTLEIFGHARSTYCWALRMACAEKGVAYELVPVAPNTPEARAVHPFGKIPAMRHGAVRLCETKAIATYIDQTFDGSPLFPREPEPLALAEQWVSLVNTAIDPAICRTYVYAYIWPRTPDGAPNRAAIEGALPTIRAQLAVLDEAAAGSPHLAGAELSFADLNLMPILYRLRQFPEGAALFDETRHLPAYYERLAARPSFTSTLPPPGAPKPGQAN